MSVPALYLYWCLNGQPGLTARTAGFSDNVRLENPREIYRTTGHAQRRGKKSRKTRKRAFQTFRRDVSPMAGCRADVICIFTCMFSIMNTPAITHSHKQIDSQELTDVLLFQLFYERHYL